MSLRFLTRRRDRPSSSKSSSLDTSPASTLSPLPSSTTDSFLRKGKAAIIPTEVQIISWDPKELERAGREVYISSRAAESDTFPTTTLCETPVYAAFTAGGRGGWRVEESESKTEEDGDRHGGGGHSRGGSDVGHTFFGARDVPRRGEPKRTRPKTAPRLATSAWGETVFDEPTSIHIPPPAAASDTPKSEVVEELSGSLGGLQVVEQEEDKKGLPIIRLASKARRAKARSHHAHVAGAYTVDLDDGGAKRFDGTPSSLPAETGGLGFLHRNASVSSFKDLIAGSESSGSTGLLSRIAPRRSKHAAENEENSGVGARSESLGSITKLLRSKDSSKTGKVRNAAPPSAWKTESVVTGEESSAYSSENEVSSNGHDAGSFQRHARRESVGEGLASAQHSGSGGGGTGTDRSSKRFSAQSGRSVVQVAPLSPATTAPVASPTVSGLPLPLLPSPSPTPLAHLLQRIGPPPVGLLPQHFDQRVTLIKAYILDQLPLPSPPPSNDTFPHQRSTTLADEFDKLECLAEKQLQGKNLTGLALEQAFEAARRGCGLGGRSHFEARVHAQLEDGGGAGGLRPAPRKRRAAGGRRPDTAPTVSSNDSTGSHSSAGRSPLLFGLVLEAGEAGAGGGGRGWRQSRQSEDTVLSEAETQQTQETQEGVREKRAW